MERAGGRAWHRDWSRLSLYLAGLWMLDAAQGFVHVTEVFCQVDCNSRPGMSADKLLDDWMIGATKVEKC